MEAIAVEAMDFFVMRAPALPLDPGVPSSGPGGHAGNAINALETSPRWVPALSWPAVVHDAWFQEAIHLASPDLASNIVPWLGGGLPPDRHRRVGASLLRYFTRMKSRCTPFGLFASIAVGQWNGSTRLSVAPREEAWRTSRLDSSWLEDFSSALSLEPSTQAVASFQVNKSLYFCGGRWQLAQGHNSGRKGRIYHQTAFDPTPHLEQALAWIESSGNLGEAARRIADSESVEEGEARSFLSDLIKEQVICSTLVPPLTGESPQSKFTAMVAKLGTHPRQAEALKTITAALAEMDKPGSVNPPASYQKLTQELAPLAPVDPSRIIQVDLFRPGDSLRLGVGVRTALENGIRLLNRLTPSRRDHSLSAFKRKFIDRYGSSFVPLMEAMDQEAGIGFGPPVNPGETGSPLLRNLPFGDDTNSRAKDWTSRDAYCLRRIEELEPHEPWVLDETDIENLSRVAPPAMPATLSALVVLAACSPEEVDRGRFSFFMDRYSGTSGAEILGRFCHGEPELEKRVRELVRIEEERNPDALFAEVVHLPLGRVGNVLARPCLRAWEIPYLGTSGMDPSRQIDPGDLMLGCPTGGRLVLWSRRHSREVIPRMTTAHNYHSGLPLYHFLNALKDQDGAGGGWDWGALKEKRHLPRVRKGRHILALERWLVAGSEWKAILEEAANGSMAGLDAWRQRKGIPRHIALEEADNRLAVDLEDPGQVFMLLQAVKGRPWNRLVEVFPPRDQLLAKGPEGRYTHELVIPFQTKLEGLPPTTRARCTQPDLLVPRTFPPGSEWLFLKLYAGPASQDRLLLDYIRPFLEKTGEWYDKWFFIRYADPDPHLRLRFHGSPDVLLGELLPSFRDAMLPALNNRLLRKWQIDTYEREWERYGGRNGFPLAETWFHQDSCLALQILSECLGSEGAERRWRRTLTNVDHILSLLGLDLSDRLNLLTQAEDRFTREHAEQADLVHAVSERVRGLKDAVAGAFTEASSTPLPNTAWMTPLQAIGDLARKDALAPPLPSVAGSLIHMHINRMTRTAQRESEWLLMTLLARHYRRRVSVFG